MKSQTVNRSLTASYPLVQSFYWINFASAIAFSSVYLLDCGLTSTQIGTIMAASGITAADVQPIVAA